MTLIRRPGIKPLRDEINDYLTEHPDDADKIAGGIGVCRSGNMRTPLDQYEDSKKIWFYVDKIEELSGLLKEHGVAASPTMEMLEVYEFVCEGLATIKARDVERPNRIALARLAKKIKTAGGIVMVTFEFPQEKNKMRVSDRLVIHLVEKALIEEAKIIDEQPPTAGRPTEPHTKAIVLLGQLAGHLYPLFSSKEAVYDFFLSVLEKYGYPVAGHDVDTIRKQLPLE